MIDDHRVDVAVVGQTIQLHREFWIDALDAALSDSSIQCGSQRVNASLDETVCAADSDSVRARNSDAGRADNCDGRRWDCIYQAIRAYGRDGVRAAGGNPVGSRGDQAVGAADGNSGWITNRD